MTAHSRGLIHHEKSRPWVIAVLSLVVGIAIGFGLSKLGELRSYEDCILQNVKPTSTMVAAAMIRNACDDKFRPPYKYVPSPESERPPDSSTPEPESEQLGFTYTEPESAVTPSKLDFAAMPEYAQRYFSPATFIFLTSLTMAVWLAVAAAVGFALVRRINARAARLQIDVENLLKMGAWVVAGTIGATASVVMLYLLGVGDT